MNSLLYHLKSWNSWSHPQSNSLQSLYGPQLTYYPFRNPFSENYSEPVFSFTSLTPPPFPAHDMILVHCITLFILDLIQLHVYFSHCFHVLKTHFGKQNRLHWGKWTREPNKEESFLLVYTLAEKAQSKQLIIHMF